MEKKEQTKNIAVIIMAALVAIGLIAVYVAVDIIPKKEIKEESSEILKEFYEEFNSKERTVIYYASSQCGYCELQSPILDTISDDYDMDYYDIDSSKLTKSERDEILKKLNIKHATPTTVIVENGKVVDTKVGYTQADEYIKFFADNKMIPEDAEYSAEKYITFIDYNKYAELIKDSDEHIIVIGQTGCSHCIAIKPALNSVAEDYDLTINYLNMTEMMEDEEQNFYESLKTIEYNDEEYLNSGSFGTPLILIVENGKVTHYISGSRTTSQLVREFTKLGLIQE